MTLHLRILYYAVFLLFISCSSASDLNSLASSGNETRSLWRTDVDQLAKKAVTRKQNSRFLNLFSVIEIPNTACQSSQKPLRELNGTCYHPNQCTKLGGLGHGKCADGYGVCCFCE